MKYKYIPLYILGCAFTVPGNRIEFRYGSSLEIIEFVRGNWVYRTNSRSIVIDTETMDTILIGWYTQFDNSNNGMCQISIRCIRDGDVSELTYTN